ncbi:hypothetical protein GCM10027597_01800 [Saccharopolyspora tripterygii]
MTALVGCRKRRYPTRGVAEAELLDCRIKRALHPDNNGNRHEQRVYACRRCQGWHLTSQPRMERPRP